MMVSFDLGGAEFYLGSIKEGGAGVNAGHDTVKFFEAFDDVGDDTVGKGHGNIARSDINKSGLDHGIGEAGPGTAVTFFKIGKALENGFAAADGGSQLGDGLGIGDGIFNGFGEVDFAEEGEI